MMIDGLRICINRAGPPSIHSPSYVKGLYPLLNDLFKACAGGLQVKSEGVPHLTKNVATVCETLANANLFWFYFLFIYFFFDLFYTVALDLHSQLSK